MAPKIDDMWYTRPKGVRTPSIHSTNSSQSSGTSTSTTSNLSGIPDGLQLKLVLDGHTCPPCSVRDFNEYLDRVEHSSENLAFYLWFKDYKKRFFDMPRDLQELSPPPDFDSIGESNVPRIPKLAVRGRPEEHSPTVAPTILSTPTITSMNEKDSLRKDSLRKDSLRSSDDGTLGPPSPSHPSATIAPWEKEHTLERKQSLEPRSPTTNSYSFTTSTNERHSSETAKQPFRHEVDSMIVTFLTSRGAKELNLPSQLRTRTIQAARETTHPNVFETVNAHVWDLLLRSSHPNFIRYIICNGNPPRVWFAHFLGVFTILLGLLEALLCIGYGVGRGWRVFSLPLFLIGAATSAAACYGMCVVLHGLHHRQLRPWELFRDEESGDYAPNKERKLRIFDKEVWVEEPALRQLHDRIFFQALAVASLFTLVMAAIFLSVPNVSK